MSSKEGRPTSNGQARVNVLPLQGPCGRWNEQEVDFLREILDLVGDKWSMLVVGVLAVGDTRYSDLDTAIPAISRRMLTLTLKHLQRSGLVERTSHPQVPPRVDYSLTPLGVSLLSTIDPLAAWSAEHHTEVRHKQDTYDKSTASDAAHDRAGQGAPTP
ncbi:MULTISPECIES: winged helix-turn-helix transcriptional regulator [unclassified Streptomyces]|uniref:winged helix-turn-helix transcriptional regulator n=1 Tax=unclassified Streptomyces TaxID=2593676 RepID=UPI003658E32A